MLVRLLREFLPPYRRAFLAVVGLQLVATAATLWLPALNADIIDNGVVTGDTAYILRVGRVMLAVALVQVVASGIAVSYGARAAMGVGRDLRTALFDRVLTLSGREVAMFGAPSLITRTTNDVQQVQVLVLVTANLMVSAPIMCVGGIVMALRLDVPLSALLLVAVPLLVGIVASVIVRMRPLFRTMQERIDTLNRVVREQIAGMRVIRAFVRDDRELARYGRSNDDLYDVSLAVGRLLAVMFPAVMLVFNASSVAVLWFGAPRIESGAMEIGALSAYISYLMQILMAVMMATFMFVMVPRAEVSAERISEVLVTRSSVLPPSAPVTAMPAPGLLELVDVEFRYPGADLPVLQGVSLTVGPGEVVAVVGSTGSGKSTLVDLVPRLVDVTAGSVRVGGVDVRDLAPDVLAHAVGLVPQRAHLFTGTIASNLRFGDSTAGDEELWHALRVAQADTFVAALPDGLDSAVAQGGTNVSGGQRQRLSIARALVHRPQVYLFDDAFSALDYATDAALRAALARETRTAAVLVVAQRVATIRHADRIVVLERGRAIATGTHDELMASCTTYREIVLSQVTPDEAVA